MVVARIGVIFFGLFSAVLCCEVLLRVAGMLVAIPQIWRNVSALQAVGGYKILVLGESTTAGGSISWPAQLENELNRRNPRRKFVVFNEAEVGISTALILARLEKNIMKYHPDMVVTMMGINDHNVPFVFEGTFGQEMHSFFRYLRLYKVFRIAFDTRVQSNTMRDQAQLELEGGGHPMAYIPYLKAGIRYADMGNPKEAVSMFIKAIDTDPRALITALRTLIPLHSQHLVTSQTIETLLRRNGYPVRFADDSMKNVTTKHYQQLFDELKKNHIQYIAMQYPTLSIEPIKNMFTDVEGSASILYVENKETFSDALKIHQYDDLFIDTYGGTFGHATQLGNELIAHHLADTILGFVSPL